MKEGHRARGLSKVKGERARQRTPRLLKKVMFGTTEGGAADILTKGNDQDEKNSTRGLLKVRSERARGERL